MRQAGHSAVQQHPALIGLKDHWHLWHHVRIYKLFKINICNSYRTTTKQISTSYLRRLTISLINSENKKLKEHIIKNEIYSCRENLVFREFQPSNSPSHGIILGLMNITGYTHPEIPFVCCHYVNTMKSQIFVRFLIYSERELVRNIFSVFCWYMYMYKNPSRMYVITF